MLLSVFFHCCLPISSSNQFRQNLDFTGSLFLQLVQLEAVAPLIAPPGAERTEPHMMTPSGAGEPTAQVLTPPDADGITDLVVAPPGAHGSVALVVADTAGYVCHTEDGTGCWLGHRCSFPDGLLNPAPASCCCRCFQAATTVTTLAL